MQGLPPRLPPITVNHYLTQKDRDMQLVFYGYQSQGKAVAREVEAKVEMVRNAMFRTRTDGALLRGSSQISGSVAEATERLGQYVHALCPRLGQHLPE